MKQEILVIDDNFDIRNLISEILKDKNYNVREAANYNQAVFEIEKKLPDAFSKNPRSIIYNDFSDAADSLHSRGIITKRQSEEITNTVGRN